MSDERRDERPEELPQGVIPLPTEARQGKGGCGLVGCLYGTVGLFVIALILLIIAILTRAWLTSPIPRG